MRQTRLLLCASLLAFAGAVATPGGVAAKPRKAKAAARKAKKKAKKRAKRMEKVGKVAYKKGRYDDAIIAFKAAYEALPKPKFLYNLARCHEKKGALAEAAGYYERYLTEAPDAEDREAVETQASFLTEKLKQTMARLAVTSKPPGAGLRVEGEGTRLDVATPWAAWLTPGRYELSLLLEGRGGRRRKVALSAGQEREVEVDFDAAEEAPAKPPLAILLRAEGTAAGHVGRTRPFSSPERPGTADLSEVAGVSLRRTSSGDGQRSERGRPTDRPLPYGKVVA